MEKGIDRRITYANRKYHSGRMWTGVTSGLAGVKLSGSRSMYGSFSDKVDRIINKNKFLEAIARSSSVAKVAVLSAR
jgi:hypothetical protein